MQHLDIVLSTEELGHYNEAVQSLQARECLGAKPSAVAC